MVTTATSQATHSISAPRWPVLQRPLPAYSAAFALTFAAFLLRWQLGPIMGTSGRVVFFTIATAISAFFFGRGPGIFSTIFGLSLADYFFIEPIYSFGHYPTGLGIALGISVLQGLGVSWCAGYLHHSLKMRHAAAQEAHALYEAKNQAHLASEELNRTKDYFLAVLSHELRGPLNAISFCVESRQNDPELPAEVREDFALIDRNTRMQSRLISDLLDLTRLTRGKMEIELHPVDVHLLLHEAVRATNAPGQTAAGPVPSLRLQATETWVHGDRDRLFQVFWNLLRNAGKFTPSGGQIEVETFEPQSGKVAVRVRDTGVGLTPEAFERIFQPFEQAARVADQKQGGLGLGLAIARGLVELHEGSLKGESDGLGHGSSFTVELPTINHLHPPADSRRVGSYRPIRTESDSDRTALRVS